MTAIQDPHSLTLDLPDEAATKVFAEDVAAALAPGDVVALHGDLGAGKTTFARALIRAVADDPRLEVPSPTFTLVQTYAVGRMPIAHFDLYRLSAPEELGELGLDEAIAGGAALVEWPDRVGNRLPHTRLDIAFVIAGDGRRATVSGAPDAMARFAHSRTIRAFLDRAGWTGAARRHLQGDASTRRYERIRRHDRTAVVMDWPAANAPAVLDPRVIFRARDVRAVVAVGGALRGLGLSAPEIRAADIDAGLLLLEDIGAEPIHHDGVPDRERYETAIDVLALLHAQARPTMLPLPDRGEHALPAFTAEAFAVEVSMFLDWYVPHVTERPATPAARDAFTALWAEIIACLDGKERGWVLLDYHSPNLFWLPDRTGLARLAIIDFQDLMVGPSAYDVASLCQDARVTIPAGLEAALRARYAETRRAADPEFDSEAFAEAYAILSAQRATKILGVFARLADHAGKPGYLRHMPRLREYLERSLAHPAMSRYARWLRENLPP
ncbi:MAG: tRNA (adenosine(37)-N6)-threonylcarbamoyltransferase complex ATPase subunit type 1 TsaE [Bauldia sp.]|nr:tRNA (adenosine(37)-N6)-threonylcarbamoyltransferase complex ATPase subunit type 1 TsaE [Bauldia sp.]